MKQTISQVIRDYGKTNLDIADEIGISPNTLANYSRWGASIANMPTGVFLRIANALEISPEQLMLECGPDDMDEICIEISGRRPSNAALKRKWKDDLDECMKQIYFYEKRLENLKQYVSGDKSFVLPQTTYDINRYLELTDLCNDDINDIRRLRADAKKKKEQEKEQNNPG